MTISQQTKQNDSPVHIAFQNPLHERKNGNPVIEGLNPDERIWKSFLAHNPVLKYLRPDYYLIFKFSDTCKILFQENISLDLGGREITLENIYQSFIPEDLMNIRSIDQALMQLIHERRLQPLDYVYRVCGNVSCGNASLKRLMRTSILIHCDQQGKASIGFMCFHDVSGMISSIRPQGYDISFEPGLHFLSQELDSKLRKHKTSGLELTRREKEILKYIRIGMSSKEIASCLFISMATVNTHRQNMLRKYEVPNTAALMRKVEDTGGLD